MDLEPHIRSGKLVIEQVDLLNFRRENCPAWSAAMWSNMA